MTLLLPDVSEWQPGTDMAGIKAKNGGAAIIRAAYGASHPDKVFTKLRNAAHSTGFKALGIYHYIVAGQDITAQAREFVRLVGKRRAGEWFIADIEEGSGGQSGRAKAWISYVRKHLGGVCWVYSGEYFSGAHGLRGVAPLWIAAYRSSEPTAKHVLWQCTNGSTGAHITNWPGAGRCDTNLFHGSLADLVALIGGQPEEEDVPEYVSVGSTKPMDFPSGQWVTLEFDHEYADSAHHHWNKGGSSVITGPAKYSLTCFVTISGLPVGTEGQIRLTRVATDDGSDRRPGPIQEFTATKGYQYLTYAIPVDSIGKGRKTRVELKQFGDATAKIDGAQLKALVWSA